MKKILSRGWNDFSFSSKDPKRREIAAMQSFVPLSCALKNAKLLTRNIRVPVVDLNRPSPSAGNSNRRSAIYIRPRCYRQPSDRVRLDRKFNCVTRQRLIHGSTFLLAPCVVTARNYWSMQRAVDPGDYLFPTVYLNPKALELTRSEPIA